VNKTNQANRSEKSIPANDLSENKGNSLFLTVSYTPLSLPQATHGRPMTARPRDERVLDFDVLVAVLDGEGVVAVHYKARSGLKLRIRQANRNGRGAWSDSKKDLPTTESSTRTLVALRSVSNASLIRTCDHSARRLPTRCQSRHWKPVSNGKSECCAGLTC